MVNRFRLYADIYGVNLKFLTDRNHLIEFMDNLSEKLNMRILFPPVVVGIPVKNPSPFCETNDKGLSGFMLWMESGCHIHTWPEYSFMSIDLYTCKEFNLDDALKVIKDFFPYEKMNYNFMANSE